MQALRECEEGKATCGQCDYCRFRYALSTVFALYPSAAMSELTVPAYWSELHGFDLAVVVEALSRARKESPKWMASGPDIRGHAAAIARTLSQPAHGDLSRPALQAPNDGRTLPDDHPCMILARSWEEESRRLRLDPMRPPPGEVADRRMRQIVALLDGSPMMQGIR